MENLSMVDPSDDVGGGGTTTCTTGQCQSGTRRTMHLTVIRVSYVLVLAPCRKRGLRAARMGLIFTP
eukprot:2344467-Prymnesium_polylepis.2